MIIIDSGHFELYMHNQVLYVKMSNMSIDNYMHNQDEYVVEVVNWTLNTYKFIENQIFYVENEHR